jgi:hypothetical protein
VTFLLVSNLGSFNEFNCTFQWLLTVIH